MRSYPPVSRPLLRFLAAVPLMLAVAGCDASLGIPTFFEVVYTVRNDSLGTITEFTFIDDLGFRRTITPGGDGVELQYLIPEGQRIGATAEGTVQDGEMFLEITVVGGAGGFTRTDSCEDFTGDPVACSLEIPEETL